MAALQKPSWSGGHAGSSDDFLYYDCPDPGANGKRPVFLQEYFNLSSGKKKFRQ